MPAGCIENYVNSKLCDISCCALQQGSLKTKSNKLGNYYTVKPRLSWPLLSRLVALYGPVFSNEY